MQNDKDLTAALIALQIGLISPEQLAAVRSAGNAKSGLSILRSLLDQGHLSGDEVQALQVLAARNTTDEEDVHPGERRVFQLKDPHEMTSLDGSAGERTIGYDSPGNESFRLDVSEPVGRYRMKALHAVGGIGEIWLARDTSLERDVAVKRLNTASIDLEVARRRFLREAKLTGRLDHPGIVPIYELCFESDGRPFYAMRFLKGRTFTEAVKEYHRKHLKPGVTPDLLSLLNALTTVCLSVAYAHSKRILHRDLKCENVMLGDFGEVVVIDWGLAKEIGDGALSDPNGPTAAELEASDPLHTVAGHILGSPAYMAPEQAAGEVDLVGPTTDVYGLSAILYEILTGRPPFSGKSTVEVLYHVQHDTPIAPTALVPWIPDELERICLKGLAKRQADRHESAEQLATALQTWLGELAERRQAEDGRERFFELSLDLLAIVTDDGLLQQVSPAWTRVLHYDRDGLIERRFVELIHPSDRPILEELFARPLADRSVAGTEARILDAEGGARWISWNVTPIAKDRCHYVVGRNVTELKQSQQLFEGVLQSSPDAMVIVDAVGTIVMVSRQTEAVFGYSADEMVGRPVEMLVPEEARARHPQYVTDFFSQATVRPMGGSLPLSGRRKDGSLFRADVALSPIRLDREMLVAASVRAVIQ